MNMVFAHRMDNSKPPLVVPTLLVPLHNHSCAETTTPLPSRDLTELSPEHSWRSNRTDPQCPDLRAPVHLHRPVLHHRLPTELQSVQRESQEDDRRILDLRGDLCDPCVVLLRLQLGQPLRLFPSLLLGRNRLHCHPFLGELCDSVHPHNLILPEGHKIHLENRH